MLNVEARSIYSDEHASFRDAVRKFIAREVDPHFARWESEGKVDRAFFKVCGDAGYLCPTVAEAYGGAGASFLYNCIIDEEFSYYGFNAGTGLQSDIVADYIVDYGSEAQKQKYLPKMVSGELITAIAMTEPNGGSDLQAVRTTARRDGDEYVVKGSKTFITNGQNADLIIVVAKTNPDEGARGISLVLVESDRPGFSRGRNLDKIGQWSADTSELFFDDVRVPIENCLGGEGRGFGYLMQRLSQERLVIAVGAQANAQRAMDEAIAYTKDRRAFGKTVFEFQNTRFTLADLAAKLQVGWAHVDWAIARHLQGKLNAAEASAAKYWHTELQWEICDAALQLHGGAGYMNEQPIARLWRDARVQRIYGGTSEIMREVVSRAL